MAGGKAYAEARKEADAGGKGRRRRGRRLREFVLEVVQRVAAADKSGGFLGIGGERVSAHESAAIEEIRAALS